MHSRRQIHSRIRLRSFLRLLQIPQGFAMARTLGPATLTAVLSLHPTLAAQEINPPATRTNAAAPAPLAPETPLTDATFNELLQNLAAPSYTQRQAALQNLRNHAREPGTLRQIAASLRTEIPPESVRRLIEVLEEGYRNSDFRTPQAAAISEILEESANSGTWYLAETAQSVLDRLWKRRVEIAITELQQLGVPLEPANPEDLWAGPAPARSFPGDLDGRRDLRIYIDENWPADPRAFTLLRRLKELAVWSLMGGAAVAVYRLEGHPLTVEQTAVLKSIFGDLRVQDRGRVCLGITSQPAMQQIPGVLIGRVEDGSAAARAGLKPGDLVQSLNGEPLTDFEELVTLLREYRVGDKVTLKVRSIPDPDTLRFRDALPPIPDDSEDAEKKGIPNPARPRDVEVVLQGWYDRAALIRSPRDIP
jgi:hypothetical protein